MIFMSADRKSQSKIIWVIALLGGAVAVVLVFYLGYTNAAAAGGIMPERCIYRIFCYTVSLPAVAFLRLVPIDSWLNQLLVQSLELSGSARIPDKVEGKPCKCSL